MRNLKEYCGIFGIYNAPDAARKIYYGLHALQHRGQESSGIVTSVYDEQKQRPVMQVHKDFGLVLDIFNDPSIFDTILSYRRRDGRVYILPPLEWDEILELTILRDLCIVFNLPPEDFGLDPEEED